MEFHVPRLNSPALNIRNSYDTSGGAEIEGTAPQYKPHILFVFRSNLLILGRVAVGGSRPRPSARGGRARGRDGWRGAERGRALLRDIKRKLALRPRSVFTSTVGFLQILLVSSTRFPLVELLPFPETASPMCAQSGSASARSSRCPARLRASTAAPPVPLVRSLEMLYSTAILLVLAPTCDAFQVASSLRASAKSLVNRATEASMAPPRVVVTGMGLVSCIGNTLDEVTDALYNGKSGITFSQEFVDAGMKSHVSGAPVGIPLEELIGKKQIRFMGQNAKYAYLSMEGRSRTPVSPPSSTRPTCASPASSARPIPRPRILARSSTPSLAASGSSRRLVRTARRVRWAAASRRSWRRSSSGKHPILDLLRLLHWRPLHRPGHGADPTWQGPMVFCGAGESGNWRTAVMFDAMTALSTKYNENPTTASRAFDEGRDGFVIGAGGGVVVVEELEHAKARGAKICTRPLRLHTLCRWHRAGLADPSLRSPRAGTQRCLALCPHTSEPLSPFPPSEFRLTPRCAPSSLGPDGELVGYGATADGYDMVAPSGKGGERAMELAMNMADELGGKKPVDYVNTHGTSTPVGDVMELKAIKDRFADLGYQPYVGSTKSITGHAVGAAGVHEAIYSLLMLNKDFLAESINIENIVEEGKDMKILRERYDGPVERVMSNSFGFGGTNCCLVFDKYTRVDTWTTRVVGEALRNVAATGCIQRIA